MSDDRDDALMTAVRDGDLDRLGPLFDRHQRALLGFFSRLTADREASEDLVQEVFVRMLRYRATYRRGSQFRTWMYSIARNAHLDHVKGRARDAERRAPLAEPDQAPSAAPGPAERLDAAERAGLLRTALGLLPPEKREVIVLSRFEGLRYDQVAELLGIEVGAVKVRVYRAMQDLRDIVAELSGGGRSCHVSG